MTRGRRAAPRTEDRSVDNALAITRDGFDQVVLECRSTHNCQYFRIIGELGFTNDHVYAETPDWLIDRLSRVPIQPASFRSAQAQENNEEALDLHRSDVHAVDVETESTPDMAEPLLESRLQAAADATIPPEVRTATADCAAQWDGLTIRPTDRLPEGGTPTGGCPTEVGRPEGPAEPDAAQPFITPASPSESAAPAGETPPCEQLAGDSVELPAFNPPSSEDSSDKPERA